MERPGSPAIYLPTHCRGRGTASPVRAWQVQSSAVVTDDGAVVSLPDYRASGWPVAPPRSTVMAALLANGQYPDIMYSTNLRDIVDPSAFEVPWWYRSTFTVAGSERTILRLDGVIHKADLFVNGTQVAGSDEIAGAYTVSAFDVSSLVRRGHNAVAVLVHPGNPLDDLSIGWVDWNQWPPDNNMGIWRDVVVLRTGESRIVSAFVSTDLSLPRLDRAELSVVAELQNLTGDPIVTDLRAVLSGPGTVVGFGRELTLGPHETRHVAVSPAEVPELAMSEPAVWWPIGEGAQPLYDLHLTLGSGGVISDQHSSSFGIRSVTSTVERGGGRRFVLNGRPVPITGAGWAPDVFLRHDPTRTADELNYAVDLGLNTIRLEGKLENPEFFEMTDALGLMVMPGWECCDKWEGQKGDQGTDWVEDDYFVAHRSMASEAALLRGHPSVICFLIGSDFAPPPRTAALYVDALRGAGWQVPIVSAATVEGTEEAGPSGMKMTGPYAWVPPRYWYSDDRAYGGAVGFNSEAGAGGNIPRLPSLLRMLAGPELTALWSEADAKQFHAGPPSEFDNISILHAAVAGRYGSPSDRDDFIRKAQLANYEATRAQFEAYGARFNADEPATGMIYWMLNSGWPGLNWQLYDWYLDPAAPYFGAKKANETLHAQYAYGTGEVLVVNRSPEASGALRVGVRIRDLHGGLVEQQDVTVASVPARGSLVATKVPLVPEALPEGATVYFLELSLEGVSGAGAGGAGPGRGAVTLGRNVYWLSTVADEIDWSATTWKYTPTTAFADLRGLVHLPPTTIDASAESRREAGVDTAIVRLRNLAASGTPAVGVHCSVVAGGTPVAPILWTDNDVTLFGGDELSLKCTYSLTARAEAQVEIEGFNLADPIAIPLRRR